MFAIGLLGASRAMIGHSYAFAQVLWVIARVTVVLWVVAGALLSGYFSVVGCF